jgi:GDP/UDP-N,N'-diacetylbacillosamine 2-epimerase (hydrolysing)
MKVGVLTSSRADFGIYLPLLNRMRADNAISIELIVFGTHLSTKHGYTKNEIIANGFTVNHEIDTLLEGDSAYVISKSIGHVNIKFADFWDKEQSTYDIVLTLGDRFEMFAAVTAGIPFGVKFAHIHAGEITLGAIDNIFRHSISHASFIHFTSTLQYAKRIESLIDNTQKNIFHVGALSLDTLQKFNPMNTDEFKSKWDIDLTKPTVLTTFHPETVAYDNNKYYATILCDVIEKYCKKDIQFLITMPNTDTSSNCIRETFKNRFSKNSKVFLIENLGTLGYFTAIINSKFILGNSSSGIIEAASFNKFAINLGKRQEGRMHAENVIDCDFDFDNICKSIDAIKDKIWEGGNPYFNGGASDIIIRTLKKLIV